ncbi:DUF6461 domain-containing protein [Streptomyces lavendulae]|uniref:DUF6461 domain-containing protein n=1 Tax=Streptomyces lavendulae TaxID=1914 RepID=UPI003CC5D95A
MTWESRNFGQSQNSGSASGLRDGDPGVDTEAAVLALAERLTGVGVTEKLLAEDEYQGESRRGTRQGVRERHH